MNPTQCEAALAACDVVLQRAACKWQTVDMPYDDALQEARLAVWEALPRYCAKYTLHNFAATVARNHLVDLHRARMVRQRKMSCVPILTAEEFNGMNGVTADTLPDPNNPIDALEGQMWVQQIVATLNGREKVTADLYLHGWRYAEIARHFGYTRPGTKGQFARLFRKAISRVHANPVL